MRALRILLWLATALLIGAGLGAPLLFEPSLGSLEGRLIARDSGHPVAAAITLSGPAGFHARSDAAGRFSFLRIPTGVYYLDAASRGHVVTNRAVYLQEARPTAWTWRWCASPPGCNWCCIMPFCIRANPLRSPCAG